MNRNEIIENLIKSQASLKKIAAGFQKANPPDAGNIRRILRRKNIVEHWEHSI